MVNRASRRAKRPVQGELFDASRAQKKRKRTPGVKLGRPPKATRLGFVAHTAREAHDERHPVHISMRRVKGAPSLRTQLVYQAIVAQLARAKRGRSAARIVHHSVQNDHLHLIAEGNDRQHLANQMRKLLSRIALAVNIVLKRRGKLFRDRHHREELKTPTQVRNALVYVLFNDRKHHAQNGGAITEAFLSEIDACSSAAWLPSTAWKENARPPPAVIARIRARSIDEATGESPVIAPDTWLARAGWRDRGGGPLSLHELPRFLARR